MKKPAIFVVFLVAVLAVAAGVGASMALFRYLTGGGAAW